MRSTIDKNNFMNVQATSTEIYPSITTRLQTQHESIQVIISTINSKQLDWRVAPDKWNIHETIAHLVCYQAMFTDRVVQALTEEVPFFPKYDADKDRDFKYWCTDDIQHLILQLFSDREKLVKLIAKITNEDANRIAMHKKYGSHNIVLWVEFFLLHEAHHIYQIFQLAYNIEMKN